MQSTDVNSKFEGQESSLQIISNFDLKRKNYPLLTFFKIIFSKNSFGKTVRVPNSLDPDQGPDLGPNYLQR